MSRLPMRPGRRGLVVLLAMLLLPASLAAAQSGGSRAPDDGISAVGSATIEELSACLQERPNLAVAVLIDETGSLRRTDPDGRRAPVLAGFLQRLEDLAGSEFGDRSRQVLVTVAYYGTGVAPYLDWQPIDRPVPGGAGSGSVVDAVLRETPGRDADLQTQFSSAIDWATDRHREVPRLIDATSVCTLSVWFSDGELDPDNQPGAAYERSAVQEETGLLCDAGGVLDAHRDSGAVLVGILLVEDGAEAPDTTLLPRMHAMVEGTDPAGRDCGTRPSRGLYLEGGLDLLSLRFERAVTPGQGGVLQGTYTGDPVRFMVDPGVARVRIVMDATDGFALTTASGGTLEVLEPSGSPQVSGLPGGAAPDIRWASGAVSVDVAVGNDFGEWRIDRNGRASEVDVYYFADLDLTVPTEDLQLTSGEPGTVEGRVVDGDGNGVDLSVYASVALDGAVDGERIAVELLADGSFRAVVEVAAEEARIPARFRLVATTSGGTVLQPVQRDFLLPVTLPAWFPGVEIAADFDAALVPGGEDVALRVVATGSELGPTRVCVRPGVLGDGAEELRDLVSVAWSPRDLTDCIELATGERVEADLVATLRGSDVRQRSVGVPIVVVLESAAVDGRASSQVDYEELRSVTVEPPAPSPWIVLLLLLLGLLIPLLLLHLLNIAAARFRTRNLQMARVPVELVHSHGTWRVARQGAPGGSLLDADELHYLATPGPDGAREWPVSGRASTGASAGGETWRAIVPRWPLGSVRAVVEAPAGQRVISNEVPTVTGDGTRAGAGLNPQRLAYVLVTDDALRAADEEDARVPATLVTVLGHAGSQAQDVVADHARQLENALTDGGQVDAVRDAVRASDAAAAASAARTSVASGAASAGGDPGAGAGGSDAWGTPGPSGNPGGGSTGGGWDSPPPPPPGGGSGGGSGGGWDAPPSPGSGGSGGSRTPGWD